MSSEQVVRPIAATDWPAVERIYAEGIATGQATFEAAPPSSDAFFASKVRELSWLAEDRGEVLGWVAAAPVSSRPVYQGVVEHSVYVSDAARGRGVGRLLLRRLLTEADAHGFWIVQSSVFRENTASMGLHLSEGFREVGFRERIARMSYGPHAGEWRDTVLLEWRSRTNGLA